jgi:hypothetical protein
MFRHVYMYMIMHILIWINVYMFAYVKLFKMQKNYKDIFEFTKVLLYIDPYMYINTLIYIYINQCLDIWISIYEYIQIIIWWWCLLVYKFQREGVTKSILYRFLYKPAKKA